MKKIAFWAIALLALSTGALGDTFKVPEYGLGTEQITGKAASLFEEEERNPVYVPPYGLNHSEPLTPPEMDLVSVDDGTPPTKELNLAFVPSEVAYGKAGDVDFNTSVSCNTTHCVVTLKAAAPQATMAEWKFTVYSRTTTKYGYDSATVAFSASIEIAVCPCGTVQMITIPLESELMSGQDLVIWNHMESEGASGNTYNRVVQIDKKGETGITFYYSS
jgi:hypothetical protein